MTGMPLHVHRTGRLVKRNSHELDCRLTSELIGRLQPHAIDVLNFMMSASDQFAVLMRM